MYEIYICIHMHIYIWHMVYIQQIHSVKNHQVLYTVILFDKLPNWATATWVQEESEAANLSGIWGMANAYPMDSRDSDCESTISKTWKEFLTQWRTWSIKRKNLDSSNSVWY